MGNVPAGLSVSKHNQSTGYKWSKCDWEPFQVIVNIKLKIGLSVKNRSMSLLAIILKLSNGAQFRKET